MRAGPDRPQLEQLTHINTVDILGAFGLKDLQRGRRLLAQLCRRAARRFAEQVIEFDRLVGEQTLAAGADWVLRIFQNRLSVSGQENIPSGGPLLIVANHPGLTDTVALFTAIPRNDLRVIAADRPFLRVLPNTSRHLIYIDEEASHNLSTVRAGVVHLRSAGALLTFPGGAIEPDPAVLPGAAKALANWSESVALFARLVPAMQIVPALVCGVLSPRAQHNPLRYLRRTQKNQEWLAAMLQILVPSYQPVEVRVSFGLPIKSGETGRQALLPCVREAMKQLMKNDKRCKP